MVGGKYGISDLVRLWRTRAATVAAPVHIVVAHMVRLLPDLATLFSWISQHGTKEFDALTYHWLQENSRHRRNHDDRDSWCSDPSGRSGR
jgi:hypothetical protein